MPMLATEARTVKAGQALEVLLQVLVVGVDLGPGGGGASTHRP